MEVQPLVHIDPRKFATIHLRGMRVKLPKIFLLAAGLNARRA